MYRFPESVEPLDEKVAQLAQMHRVYCRGRPCTRRPFPVVRTGVYDRYDLIATNKHCQRSGKRPWITSAARSYSKSSISKEKLPSAPKARSNIDGGTTHPHMLQTVSFVHRKRPHSLEETEIGAGSGSVTSETLQVNQLNTENFVFDDDVVDTLNIVLSEIEQLQLDFAGAPPQI